MASQNLSAFIGVDQIGRVSYKLLLQHSKKAAAHHIFSYGGHVNICVDFKFYLTVQCCMPQLNFGKVAPA